jgi:predicted transcriptional regulator
MVCIRTDAERLESRLNIRLNHAAFAQISTLARRSNQTPSRWARAALADALKREAAEAAPKRAA